MTTRSPANGAAKPRLSANRAGREEKRECPPYKVIIRGTVLNSLCSRPKRKKPRLSDALSGASQINTYSLFQNARQGRVLIFGRTCEFKTRCGRERRRKRRVRGFFGSGGAGTNPGCVAEMSHSFSPSHVNLGQTSVPMGFGFSARWALIPSIGRIGCRCSQIREIKIFLKWRLPVFRGSLS